METDAQGVEHNKAATVHGKPARSAFAAKAYSHAEDIRRPIMQKNLFQCSVRWALAAVCLGATINGSTAGSFTRGCAARDLQILMLIEERESTNAISAEKLSEAMLTMMHARMVCFDGFVVDALTIYDNVARSISPNPVIGRPR